MAWTYDIATNRGKVRFLIQDTNTNVQLLSDAEVDFALTQSSNLYRAAAIAARAIALNFTRKLTLNPAPGGVSLDPQEQAEKYMALAKDLDAQAGRSSTAGGGLFAGGISVADKESREADTDRTAPAFTTGLHSAFSSEPNSELNR